MWKILHNVVNMLSAEQKREGVYVALLLVVHSLLDFFSLAFFLPVILLLLQSNAIESNAVLHWLSERSDIHDVTRLAMTLTVMVFVFILIKTVINQWITARKASFAYHISTDIGARVANQYLNKDYSDFTHTDFSREVNTMVSAPLAFANNIIIPAGTLLSESLVFAMISMVIAWYDLTAFLLVLVILTPAYFMYSARKKKIAATSRKLNDVYPQLLKRSLEITEGLIDIRSLQKEAYFREKFLQSKKSLDKVLVEDHTSQTGTSRVTELIAAACICVMIIFALLTQRNPAEMFVLLGMYAGASFRIIPSVNRIFAALHQIRTHEHIVNELRERGSPAEVTNTHPVSFQQHIVLDQISFQYPGQAPLLKNLTVQISKGQKIALTGSSGAGKSTLLLVLLRYLHETSGQILVDGKPLDANGPSWRRLCGYVPQKPFILDATIAANIAFGEAAPNLERVQELVKDVALSPWISALPDGIHTTIGEKGVRISGGQLQRLAIARALYAKPELLLLDEITTQLDASTEAEIIELLIAASGHTTILMITHNPALWKRFDVVLDLMDGTIIERRPVSIVK